MDTSIIASIQNQLVTHINKTFKASTDEEIVVDKTILTCCPADEDIRLIMDTEFRKLLINDGLFYTGASNSDQLCIQKIKSYPIDYTDEQKSVKIKNLLAKMRKQHIIEVGEDRLWHLCSV